jgi:hypothetical protein
VQAVPGLAAGARVHHPLHGETSDWPETNCYADFWIELLHALQLEPLAMLGHTLAVDFEGDQWTFFKPSQHDLRDLYGIDVQEMTVWRPLEEHAVEHLAAGKLLAVEADSFWLPDTTGTDYRNKHTKTTIVIAEIDPQARRLGYFHNAGYFELGGEDYASVFRIGAARDPADLPLFAELLHVERRVQRAGAQLAQRALVLLREHFEWRPAKNPFTRFGERFERDLPHMREAGLDHYHAWAFASIRQAGAAFELAAAHLDWLARFGHPHLEAAAKNFREISSANKSLILKGARAAHTGKAFDAGEPTRAMARAWDAGMAQLSHALVQSPP